MDYLNLVPYTQQTTRHYIPTHGTVILTEAHYKLMPIRFFLVATKNDIIISDVASTERGLHKVLCHNRATQCKHLDAIKNMPCKMKTHLQQQWFAPYKAINTFNHLLKTTTLTFPLYKKRKPSTTQKIKRTYSWIHLTKKAVHQVNTPSHLIPMSNQCNTECAESHTGQGRD